jgi:hypothetical protein
MQAQQGKAWHDRPAREFTAFSAGLFVCAIRNTESEPQHTTCVCVRSQCTQQGTCARDYVLVRNRNKALAEPSAKFRSTRSVTYSSDCASSS